MAGVAIRITRGRLVERGVWSSPRSAALQATIDRALTDQAAWIGYATPRKATFLGSRVGNLLYHPVWWMLLDQLWVR